MIDRLLLKRILAAIIALMLIFGLMPVSVLADAAKNVVTEAALSEASEGKLTEREYEVPTHHELPEGPEAAEALNETPADEPEEALPGAAAHGAPIVPMDAPWSGSGTESNPYLIQSDVDLIALRDYIAANENATWGLYFKQTINLTLEAYCGPRVGDWTPIGNESDKSYCFSGIYDGDGHTISDLYIANGGKNAALFCGFPEEAIVRNLGVSGTVSGGYECGGLCGWNKGTITNCVFTGSVTAVSEDRAGGIAGYTKTGLTGCRSTATVSGKDAIGGIAGYSDGPIVNCTSTNSTVNGSNYVGGIIGFAAAGSSIVECEAYGNISGADTVGGIVGRGSENISISDCYFSGSVTCSHNTGGIVGYMHLNGSIDNCEADADVQGGMYAGGIAGRNYSPINNCTVRGTVDGGQAIGGITGEAGRDVRNSTNYSTVTATGTDVGGIAGFQSYGEINNCINYGDVTSPNNWVGGIVGYSYDQSNQPIVDCTNYGNVTGKSKVGGIVGQTNRDVTNCHNYGTVTGETCVGDIAGVCPKTTTIYLKPNGAGGEDQTEIVSSYPPAAPQCPFTREGYKFIVWSTTADGNGTIYLPGDNIDCGSSIELHAMWGRIDSLDFGTFTDEAIVLESWMGGFPLTEMNYIAEGTVNVSRRMEVGRYLQFIYLKNGCTLNALKGITVPEGDILEIMDINMDGSGTGVLNAYSDSEGNAAIGGVDCRYGPDRCGEIWIAYAKVNATGSSLAAAIGSGYGGTCRRIMLMDGTVNATGGSTAIGNGSSGNGGQTDITIQGGTVTATSTSGPGIGCDSWGADVDITITITDGTVTANGSVFGAGIGTGFNCGGLIGIHISGGSVTANADGYGAGIGTGCYNQHLYCFVDITGGTVNASGIDGAGIGPGSGNQECTNSIRITGGSVTASSENSEAIGFTEGELTLGDVAVWNSANAAQPVAAAERANAFSGNYARITPCEHRLVLSGDSLTCTWCGKTHSLSGLGSGTTSDPYRIGSTANWDTVSVLLENGFNTVDKHFILTANISVTKMIGTSANPFCGVFDGSGKTLTFNSEDHPDRTAPFKYIRNADIRSLHVTGSITGTTDRASGLIGENIGVSTISNCRVSATLSGNKLIGGFCVGAGDGQLIITGCVFDGKINANAQSGCFVAWGTGGLSIIDCVADPQSGSSLGGGTFCYVGNGSPTFTNSYYITPIGTAQGKQAYSITAAEGITLGFGQGTQYGSVGGVTGYQKGLSYDGVFYAGANESISLSLTSDTPQGFTAVYSASAGTLAGSNGSYTLTMPAENVTISAEYFPALGSGTADDPWQIPSRSVWDSVAESIENGFDTTGRYYILTANISVSTMMGTASNPFSGVFDGDGKTLTFNYLNHPELTAPFRYVNNAAISNLHVEGNITGTTNRVSGLIGENSGTSTVTNCRVSATLSGNALIAGFCVGAGNGQLIITGCVFDGEITGDEQCGCFVAWATSGLRLIDCVAAPQSGSEYEGGTFFYTRVNLPNALTNCYYTRSVGDAQGKQAYSVTAGEGVTIGFGTPAATYGVSGITAYPTGLGYGGVFCAGNGDEISLTLDHGEAPAGQMFSGYNVGAGTLIGNTNPYSLTMPAEDVTITAVFEVIRSYTITYTVNGEEYTTQVYEVGAPVTAPEYDVPEGYTFSGWNVPETMPAEDITLDATLTINTYTVTFVDGITGEVIAEVAVEHGSDAEAPEAPEHAGYLFGGWDGDFTNVTEDLTITATYRLLGDVDGDGELTSVDALVVLRYAMQIISEIDTELADVNGDGQVNSLDALLVLRRAMGII